MGKNFWIRIITGLSLAALLSACADNAQPPTQPPLSSPIVGDFIPTATPAPTAGPRTPTTEVIALVPTNTPPAIFPTATPAPPTQPPVFTPTPRPDFSVPVQGPSLITFRATKLSFLTAYTKAAAQMNSVNGSARLALAQATTFTLDQTVWTFFFTVPNGTNTWAVTVDSGTKDKKEATTVSRSSTLLPNEAGQWQPNKVLDSDELSTRLQRNGLSMQLPFDTVYVQMQNSPTAGKVPAYLMINSTLQKELIVNALDATVIRNDFV